MGMQSACKSFFWGDAAFWSAARDPVPGLDGDKSSDPTHSSSNTKMKRELGLLDLIVLGVAAVIGAGIFVLTGVAARDIAGPAVMISYLISGIACIICALCYAEFATECSITGGSCVYVARTFGKFASWVCASNVLMELIVSSAAVAKGFAPYFCRLINQPTDAAIIVVTGPSGEPLPIDLVAMGLILLVTLLLLVGARQASVVNIVTTLVALACIIITIIAGFTKVDSTNWVEPDGFIPYGTKGIFNAASQVFFAYIGFEMVASAAEEAKNPKRDVPIATVASVGFCGILYVLMAVVITGMVPYNLIDPSAPFAVAFSAVGYEWAQYVVSIGALLAITNTVVAVQYSLSRTFVVLGRFNVLPPVLSRVHPRTQVPVVSTLVCGLISAVLATIVPLSTLSGLVSLGTLVAFLMVCLGVIWRRLYTPGQGQAVLPAAAPLATLTLAAAALGITYQLQTHYGVWIACFGVWLAATIWLAFIPQVYTPTGFTTPLFPVWPAVGVLLCLLLIGTLGPATWARWAIALVAGLAVYALWFTISAALEAKAARRASEGAVATCEVVSAKSVTGEMPPVVTAKSITQG